MGRVGQIAGVLLLTVGICLGAWGAPYYMLDWGGALVISGAVLASAGLICTMIGTVLIRLADVSEDLALLRAQIAVENSIEANAEMPQRMQHVPQADLSAQADLRPSYADSVVPHISTSPAQDMANIPNPATGRLDVTAGAGIAAGVGASVAAGGLAMATRNILGSVNKDPYDASGAPEFLADAEPVPQPQQPNEASTNATNDYLHDLLADDRADAHISMDDKNALDDLLAGLSLSAPANISEQDDDADEPAEAGPVPRSPARDDLFARIEDAVRTLRPETTTDNTSADSSSSPNENAIVPPQAEEAAFEDTTHHREELTADPDAGPGEQASPVDHATEADPTAAHVDVVVHDEEPVRPQDTDLPDRNGEDISGEHAPDDASAELKPLPVVSDEGVVAAYNVGDSAYAMLADGRIRVTTPVEQFMFQSMDELKTFMAARRA